MPSDAHTAFASLPTTARGLICKDNYQPLTIRGCAVRVDVKGYSARVHVTYEYLNETNHNQNVIAAYALPYGWHVQSCEATYNGDVVRSRYVKNATVTSVDTASAVALLGGSASSADRSTAWCSVVAQSIPWTVMVGDAVCLSVQYAVTLPATDMISYFEMSLPMHLLVPPVTQPSKTTLEYNSLYATTVTRSTYLPAAEVTVHIHTELCLPMRGEVKLTQLELDMATQTTVEDARVNRVTDTVFTLDTKGHISVFPRLPLIFGCGVQDTEEPLRLFIESDMGSSGVRDEEKHAVAIGFTPRLYDIDPNIELVLLVDVHSRENSALIARAVTIGLAALPPSVHLNAVVLHGARTAASARTFGTCVFPNGSRPISDVDLGVFSAAIQSLADGTPQPMPGKGEARLAEALRVLLGETTGPLAGGATPVGYARNIVIVTDAGESEAKAPIMIQEAVSSRHRARVHAIGLSTPGDEATTVDVAQLTILAKQSGGLFVLATTSDVVDVTRAVVRVAHASAVPTLTRIRIKLFDDAEKSSLRSAFDGRVDLPLMPHSKTQFFYGFAPVDVGRVSVIVTAHVGAQVVEYNADADIAAQPESQHAHQSAPGDVSTMGRLHVAAAAARIEYLVESHPHNAAPSSAESKEIIALSMHFAVASPYTQLVQSRQNAEGAALTGQVIPVAARYLPRCCLYPTELHSVRAALMTAKALSPSPLSAPATGAPAAASTASSTSVYLRGVVHGVVDAATRSSHSVEELLRLQAPTDGGYTLGAQLAACVGLSLPVLESRQPQNCPSQTAWATAVALEAMRQAQDRLTLLATARAEKFLAAQCASDANHNGKLWQQWLAAAQALMDE